MAAKDNIELQRLQRGRFQLNTSTSIRLLTLLDGASGSHIQMTLQVVDLEQNPKFVALSYEWGDPDLNEPNEFIYVNEQPVSIRRNLFNFLTRLRNHRAHNAIWTDAICIDQDRSKPELKTQLALMARIYSQAQKVRACIGEDDEDSRAVFKMEYGDKVSFGGKHYGGALALAMLPTYPFVAGRKMVRHAHLKMNKAPITHWKKVLERRYFTRTWVVQELLLAKEITFHCGKDTMDQRFFHKALEFYKMAYGSKLGEVDMPSAFLVFFLKGQRFPILQTTAQYQDRDIFELVYDYEYTNCLSIQDRILAVLSLEASKGQGLPVAPTDPILQMFVEVCNARLPQEVSGSTCERVAKLFIGLKLDQFIYRPDAEKAGHARHHNAEAILELALTSQYSTTLQGTLIKAFDEYGFLEPNRSYMITTTQDPQQIVDAYGSWRANPKKPSSGYSRRMNFMTLHEPLRGRAKKFRSFISAGQTAGIKNQMNMMVPIRASGAV